MNEFNKQINRKGTHSIKWDMLEERYGTDDLLSMWVADSDFKSPQFLINRLMKRAEHGIFGYTDYSDDFFNSFTRWMERHHNTDCKKEWITATPGVVSALNIVIQSLTQSGDKIIIQTPVYPPFYHSVTNNDRLLIENPLIENNNTYTMDFEHLESIIDEKTSLLILCNPHNPIGRVWTREELDRLGKICTEKDILVLSDEIHSDLILPGYKHTPFMALNDDIAQRTISAFAPSKTFNVAGLATSVLVIPNDALRKQVLNFKERIGFNHSTVFGIEAFTACYEEGDAWLQDQMAHIQENIDFVNTYLAKHIPSLKAFKMEGTYLMWLDCRALNMSQENLQAFFIQHVKIALNSGDMFGNAGKGFMRVNLATTHKNVECFMTQLKNAISSL